MSTLNILSINTRRSPACIYALFNNPLSSASVDIILIQEPPLKPIIDPYFKIFYPNPPANRPSRTLVYINTRIDPASYHQCSSTPSGDLMAIDLTTREGLLRIINIYNAPTEMSSFALLPALLEIRPHSTMVIVAGDINAHHPRWDPRTKADRASRGRRISEVLDMFNLDIFLPPGTDTYINDRKNANTVSATLDLVFGSTSTKGRILTCDTDLKFDVGSDHLPILTTLSLAAPIAPPSNRRNFKNLDEGLLQREYGAIIKNREESSLISTVNIETEALLLRQDIKKVIEALVPIARPSRFGKPWWKPELLTLIKTARQLSNFAIRHREDFEAATRARTARQHKKAAIRAAKLQYERKLLEGVTKETLWKTVRLTQNSERSQSSIPNLVKEDGSKTVSAQDKFLLLKTTLLPERVQNQSELIVREKAGDKFLRRMSDELNLERRMLLTSPPHHELALSPDINLSPTPSFDEFESNFINSFDILPPNLSDNDDSFESSLDPVNVSDVPDARLEDEGKSKQAEFENYLIHLRSSSSSASSDLEEEPREHPLTPIANNNIVSTTDNTSDTSSTSLVTSSPIANSSTRPSATPLPAAAATHSSSSQDDNAEQQPVCWDEEEERKAKCDVAELTVKEVKEAVFSAGPTSAPGADGIPFSILRALWPVIEHRVFKLYRACLKLGFEPECWKEALGVVLKKPKKPDYTTPNAYRLIALLNSLGKGLEKVVATRLSFLAETHSLLPPESFGARPGLSCEDALLAATSWIKSEKKKGRKVAAVALDVKGAFPSVVRTRLLSNLRRRGVPEEIISFVSSFLLNRSCFLVVDGVKSERMATDCGLPQGSPLSPILYIFYNADLGAILRSKTSSSVIYIDDVFAMFSARSTETLAKLIHSFLPRVSKWSRDHSSEMEPTKSHVIAFFNTDTHPLPPIFLDEIEIPQSRSLTLLGVILDAKLNFNEHIKATVVNGEKALNGIRCLSASTRGINLPLTRQLVIACVLSRLDYASTVWFKPGSTKEHTRALARVQLAAVQLITGGLKQAGLAALEFESFLLPTELRLLRRSTRMAARLLTLPISHPLFPFVALARRYIDKKPTSPFDFILRTIPPLLDINIETIHHSNVAPWTPPLPCIFTIADNKDDAEAATIKLIDSRRNSDLLLYSDGSLLENHQAGSGLAIDAWVGNERNWGRKFIGLGAYQTVYVAELEGVNLALSAACAIIPHLLTVPTNIYFLIDNQAAVTNSCNPVRSSGQFLRQLNLQLLQQLISDHPTVNLEFIWVPGHINIKGNELADELAKRGAITEFDEDGSIIPQESVELPDPHADCELAGGDNLAKSLSAILTLLDVELRSMWTTIWKNGSSGSYLRRLDHTDPGPTILRLHRDLSRRNSSILIRLRTGRSPLHAHLFKIKLHQHNRCDYCSAIETTAHFLLICPHYSTQRRILLKKVDSDQHDICSLLTNPANIINTLEFINSSDRFPRYFAPIAPVEDEPSSRK